MQINRLFEIIYILLDKNTVTAGELAKYFEVSARTIYRDIECLSGAGIPVYMSKGKGGGISLLPDFVLNKAVLTDEEKSDILSSLRAVSSVNLDETNTAIKKLSSLFGKNDTKWMEVDFTSWGNGEKEKAIFNTIKSAILKKTVICFSYYSSKGEETKREVEPLRLCFKEQGWYLYGYCRERQGYRFFKLSRIKELSMLKETFEKSAPKLVFNNADNIYTGEYISLKLKLSSEMAFRVYDEFEKFEILSDGSFVVNIDFPQGDWLYGYILSFGEACEVIEPIEVRQRLKKEIHAMSKKYL